MDEQIQEAPLSDDQIAALFQASAEEEAAAQAEAADAVGTTPEAAAVAEEVVAQAQGAPTQPSGLDALIQQLARQNDEAVAYRQQQDAANAAQMAQIQQMLNPQPAVQKSPEEQWLDDKISGATTPLMQTIESQKAIIADLQAKAQQEAQMRFVQKQHAAIAEAKNKYPDFNPSEVPALVQPYLQALTSLGVNPQAAERVIMEQFGTPEGLGMLWKAKKYDTIMSRAALKKPDAHVPASTPASAPKSIMEAINSENSAEQDAAINSLWSTK